MCVDYGFTVDDFHDDSEMSHKLQDSYTNLKWFQEVYDRKKRMENVDIYYLNLKV